MAGKKKSPVANPPEKYPDFPAGGLVLVTGVNGFVGSHVADQLQAAGYKVRGSVREASKGDWLKERFAKHYGPNSFEVVVVSDLSDREQLKKAVAGVDGVLHTASDAAGESDPNKVITPLLKALDVILNVVDEEPSVKSFVFTSSSFSAQHVKGEEKKNIEALSWNTEQRDLAWAPPPYGPDRILHVYASSKIEVELAFWDYVNNKKKGSWKPNTILPNVNFGPSLHPQHNQSSTGTIIPDFYNTGDGMINMIPHPQYMIDVRDTAKLHMAALVRPDVKDERVFGFAHRIEPEKIIQIIKDFRPAHEQKGSFPNHPTNNYVIEERGRAEEILKAQTGNGFASLEKAVQDSIAHFD